MGYNKLFIQKLAFASFLTIVNVLLVSLCYSFTQKWYIVQLPLLIIFAFQMVSILLIVLLSALKKDRRLPRNFIRPLNICYFIPCYNQSELQITSTLNSFINQIEIESHGKVYVAVCDGRKRAATNDRSTDKILSETVFPNSKQVRIQKGYINDKQEVSELQILLGETKNKQPYFVVIKEKNAGKRDSIGIIRRLCFNFNKQHSDHNILSQEVLSLFKNHLQKYNINSIEHIVGVDADTVFEPNCTIELLRQIERKDNILATTGMVKVQFTADTCIGKLMECYQHVEYIAGQGFLRNQQNLTQQKINCLPGCLNITKVCQQTCGEQLLSIYMKAPAQSDHIFQWIRGTASEDRHSVMLLLKLYGQCHTTCTWDAQAVTSVPVTPSVFLSQRKRWSLGSATHGFWMVFMPNIPFYQRLSSTIFVLTYILTPFFMYSLVTWLNTIARGNGDITFYIMTALVQLVTLYKLSIAIWIKMTVTQKIVYFASYPLYYIAGPIIGICVWSYSLYYMDDFCWGKTRTVIQTPSAPSLLQKVQMSLKKGSSKSSSQLSTTMDSINYHVSVNNPIQNREKVYQIQQQLQQERTEQEPPLNQQRRHRQSLFSQSRAFQITLTGKQSESVMTSRESVAPFMDDLTKRSRKSSRFNRRRRQTLDTSYFQPEIQNKSSNVPQEISIIMFTQNSTTQIDQQKDNRVQIVSAPKTHREEKIKVVNYQN